MKIKVGDILTIKAMEWQEDWEFDFPTVILSPFRAYTPNGRHAIDFVEDCLIDAIGTGELQSSDDTKEFEWRGWNWNYLNKVFKQSMTGKVFPVKNYSAYTIRVEIVDEDNELSFVILDINGKPSEEYFYYGIEGTYT